MSRFRVILQSASGVREELTLRARSKGWAVREATSALKQGRPEQYGWLPIRVDAL